MAYKHPSQEIAQYLINEGDATLGRVYVDNIPFNYAKMMHEGIWPSSYPNKKIAGTNIRYKVDHQPTPSSHFLERGFRETGETELARLLKGIFNGV